MKAILNFRTLVPGVLALFLVLATACKKDTDEKPVDTSVWDVDTKPLPKFIELFPIEMDKVQRISKFRSSVGHDYSDFVEHCRSMKHYFEPKSTLDWAQVKIFSPVDGKVTRVDNESMGTKVEIECSAYPAFRISIFHVNLSQPLQIGNAVTKGQLLGTHFGSATYSDVSCIANDPTKQGRMVSFFLLTTDTLMSSLTARGVQSRDQLIITRQARDASPLTCTGDQFAPGDTLTAWFQLSN